MFVLKHINQTFANPDTAICSTGKYSGDPRLIGADLCICMDNVRHSEQFINSNVLKSAILSNIRLFEMTTGLSVMTLQEKKALAAERQMQKEKEDRIFALEVEVAKLRKKKIPTREEPKK